jgi:hypothetical protein
MKELRITTSFEDEFAAFEDLLSAGVERMGSHHRKEGPRARLPAIVVSAEAVRRGSMRFATDPRDERGRIQTSVYL